MTVFVGQGGVCTGQEDDQAAAAAESAVGFCGRWGVVAAIDGVRQAVQIVFRNESEPEPEPEPDLEPEPARQSTLEAIWGDGWQPEPEPELASDPCLWFPVAAVTGLEVGRLCRLRDDAGTLLVGLEDGPKGQAVGELRPGRSGVCHIVGQE